MRDFIIFYLSIVVFIGMGIFVINGEQLMFNFFRGFIYPIIITSPLTITLSFLVLIKEVRKSKKERKR